MINSWIKNYSSPPTLPSAIMSEYIWFNTNIKIGNQSIFNRYFSSKNINFVGQLFEDNGTLKSWERIKEEHCLSDNKKFFWMQLIDAIPKAWKTAISNDKGNAKNLTIYDHHIIKRNQVVSIIKLDSKELYSVPVYFADSKPTAQIYFDNLFCEVNLDWKNIYLLPRKTTVDTRFRVFQYKILNNILYLNKALFKFGKTSSPLCSFCKKEEETIIHLFHSCNKIKEIWNNLRLYFASKIVIPLLTPQSAIFGFLGENLDENSLIINHLLLIVKFYIYTARENGNLIFPVLVKKISKIKSIEENNCGNDLNKIKKFNKKWSKIKNMFH